VALQPRVARHPRQAAGQVQVAPMDPSRQVALRPWAALRPRAAAGQAQVACTERLADGQAQAAQLPPAAGQAQAARMDRCLQEELALEARLPPVALPPRVAIQRWVALRPQPAASQAQAARTDRLADGQGQVVTQQVAKGQVAKRQVVLPIQRVAVHKRAAQPALASMRELQVPAVWA